MSSHDDLYLFFCCRDGINGGFDVILKQNGGWMQNFSQGGSIKWSSRGVHGRLLRLVSRVACGAVVWLGEERRGGG